MDLSSKCKVLTQDLVYFGIGIRKVPNHNGSVFTGLRARRKLSFCQPFGTKSALLHHTFHPCRITRIGILNKGPRITPVKASGTIRTGRHAEPTTYTPMHVHHYDTVFSLKGGLRGTDPHTGRMLTVITEQQKLPPVKDLIGIFVSGIRKSVFKLILPDPFNFVFFVRDLGHVMKMMTRVNTILTGSIFLANARVYHHAPAARCKPLLRRLNSVSLNFTL